MGTEWAGEWDDTEEPDNAEALDEQRDLDQEEERASLSKGEYVLSRVPFGGVIRSWLDR